MRSVLSHTGTCGSMSFLRPSRPASGGAISGIADKAFRCEIELRLDTLDHRPSRIDFGGTVRRGSFHVHDHTVPSVDQVIRGVGKRPGHLALLSNGTEDQ